MGINLTNGSINMLFYAKNKGVSFKNTVVIGRQLFFGGSKLKLERFLKKIDSEYKQNKNIDEMFANGTPAWSEGLFRYFGAETVDSIDYSPYEGATIIQDMNIPAGEELKEKFGVVWDGGALEHVFNYPAALKNCMEMTAVGGHLILLTPGNNWFGHGFYQFSPELFFSVLNEQNGFSETEVFLSDKKRWYRVNNPRETHRREELDTTGFYPMTLLVISRKTGETPFNITVQQSDYETIWNNSSGSSENGGKYLENAAEPKKHSRLYLLLMKFYLRFYSVMRIYRKIIFLRAFVDKLKLSEYCKLAPDFTHPSSRKKSI